MRKPSRFPLVLSALVAWSIGGLVFILLVTALTSRHWLLSFGLLFLVLLVVSVGIWLSEYLWNTLRRRARVRALRRLGLIRS